MDHRGDVRRRAPFYTPSFFHLTLAAAAALTACGPHMQHAAEPAVSEPDVSGSAVSEPDVSESAPGEPTGPVQRIEAGELDSLSAGPAAGEPAPAATDEAASDGARPAQHDARSAAPEPLHAAESEVASRPALRRSTPPARSAAAPPSVQREAKKSRGDDLLGGALGMHRARANGNGSGYGRSAVGMGGRTGRVARRGPGPMMAAPLQMAGPTRPPRPRAELNTDDYAHITDNAFLAVMDSPLSTFSIDVDTASYSNVRRMLTQGTRPPADAVRIEELLNYFDYDYPAPRGEVPFSVYTEVASAPWNPRHRLVHVGLKGREIAAENVPARNLVFLLDVSGSMAQPNKLPLLQRGMALLARQLRPQDRLAIVAYAGASGLVLPSTPGNDQGTILSSLDRLQAGGSTNGGSGIQLAYRVAQEQFIHGGINRVILATDGDFNVGVTGHGGLTRLVEQKRKSGVFLTVLGFGDGNLKDSTMETLADKGNGNYAYIDSIEEARKVLVREAGSTLITIAKDVKLQVEWNPKHVASYRLIGYENRVLAARDFNDDRKDAGEIGAGHTVTALYEVVLVGHGGDGTAAGEGGPEVGPLKYQADRALTGAAESAELMTVKIRYKRPDASSSELISQPVVDPGKALRASSEVFRFSAAVAGFGMLLRGSEHRGDASLELVRELARSALGRDAHGDRRELLQLMDRAQRIGIGIGG